MANQQTRGFVGVLKHLVQNSFQDRWLIAISLIYIVGGILVSYVRPALTVPFIISVFALYSVAFVARGLLFSRKQRDDQRSGERD
ncbi:MAG: hypothetical protein JNM47_03445 [Hyphomonadaceae bacterium]|nr:hypothetical protein [Hyphomonadaceae bacterium]